MNIELHHLLIRQREAIIEEEIRQLRGMHAPHYRSIDLNLLQLRAIRLVESYLESVQKGPALFVKYIRGMAEERFREGYFLEEIQSALNILGRKVWKIVSEKAPAESQVVMLGRATGILGAAKDGLAQIYTRKLETAESQVHRLTKQVKELFSGTVSPPDMEEEDLPIQSRCPEEAPQ